MANRNVDRTTVQPSPTPAIAAAAPPPATSTEGSLRLKIAAQLGAGFLSRRLVEDLGHNLELSRQYASAFIALAQELIDADQLADEDHPQPVRGYFQSRAKRRAAAAPPAVEPMPPMAEPLEGVQDVKTDY